MLITRRTVRTSQPQHAVGINWSNPITRGLVLACTNYPNNIVTNKALSGIATRTTSKYSSLSFDGSSGGLSAAYDSGTPGGITFFTLCYPTNSTVTNTLLGLGSGVSDRYLVLDISGTETNDPVRLIQNGGSFGGVYINSVVDFNSWQSFCGVSFVDAQNNLIYKNGSLVGVTSYGSPGSRPTPTTIDLGQSLQNTAVNRFAGLKAIDLVFLRALSSAEIKSLADNPWQIFEDEEDYLFIPAAGGGSSVSLVVSEALHGHVADSPTFSMDTYLAVAESLHSHAADNLTLGVTGATSLVVQDTGHSHIADGVALTTNWLLSISESAHAHAADGLSLSTRWLLAVADGAHGHVADNLSLDTSNATFLTMQDAAHGHGADSLGLTLSTWLAIVDAVHGHMADGVMLTMQWLLSVAEASHAHTADSLSLDTSNTTLLTVQESGHAHTADNISLTLSTWLMIVDAAHGHTADAPTLTAQTALQIAEVLHAQYADIAVLSFPGVTTLTPDDIAAIAAAVWAHATRVITGPTAEQNADALLSRTWP